MKNIVVCILLFIININVSSSQDEKANTNYLKGKLILKLLPEYRVKASEKDIQINVIQSVFEESKLLSFRQKFPHHQLTNNKNAQILPKLVDLSLIYEIEFDKQLDPYVLSQKLLKSGIVEYAEPLYIQELCFTPNDTLQHMQYYLTNIQAYDAWNISKGDSNVVIGIIDTGVDTDHPDLVGNFAYNYADPYNGIDDDNDGYIDNYLGWDVAMNDNDPGYSLWGHGVNVAGLASPSTNNVTGIAGAGFSCKILPVKIDDDASGRLVAAYEGLVYAADHGADIINNSWGSYSKSALGQDIVNYATFNKGALVIGAVGNDTLDKKFYPAAYDNVLSVGATQEQDSIKDNSNFGHWVDVFAPGNAMFTLNVLGEYQYNGGTSMAAPVVAGVAGLVRSHYPNYTPHQIAQQIITTADNIDALNAPNLNGKLGSGRVNAFRALNENFSPGIEMTSMIIDDHNDSLFYTADTLFISAVFTNYLAAATNVNINISGNNQYFDFIDNSIQLGNMANMQSKDNFSDPFRLVLKKNLPFNEEAELQLTISADNYRVKQYFNIHINPDYINVEKNLISITLTSNGRIGYNDTDAEQGLGFIYKDGESLLFEASFAIGDGITRLADAFRSNANQHNDDFGRISQVQQVKPVKADYEYMCSFNDADLARPMHLDITQKNYVYTLPPLENQIYYIYHIHNTSNSILRNLYGGIIADWDIGNFSKNKAAYNFTRKMAIAYNTDTSLYVGIKLLSNHTANHYAIDNVNNGNGGVNVFDGFSDEEKYTVLSTSRDSAGNVNQDGNDILSVLSAGALELAANSSTVLGFVILAAESLMDLYTSADLAQQNYDQNSLGLIELPQKFSNFDLQIVPIPAHDHIEFKFSIAQKQRCMLSVYDSQGRLVSTENYGELGRGDYKKKLGLQSLRSGVYFLELSVGNKKIRDKFVVIK